MTRMLTAVLIAYAALREFERYRLVHCRLALAAAAGRRDPGQAAAACEVQMLRQLAALLAWLANRHN